MNIKKPNSFARYGNDYVAPLTTIDQIVKPSGERYTDKEFELMSNVENVMFGENGCGKNLLNPTLQTTTINGVTCTNNGDGTFTLNGTNTSDNETLFEVANCKFKNGTYKILGGQGSENCWFGGSVGAIPLNGGIFTVSNSWLTLYVVCKPRATFDNLIIKPMLTTDLSATYDDFEPYVKSLKQLTNNALNMDLLWTNASPTSAFAAQTISLGINLSQYKYLLFEWIEYTSYTAHFYSKLIGNQEGIITLSTTSNRWRLYTVSSENNINMTDGRYTNGAVDNNYMIPTRIFGVK